MPKHVWIISCLFCTLSLFYYFSLVSYDVPLPEESINPVESEPTPPKEKLAEKEQANSSYQKWLSLGEKAQSEGKWVTAIRCFHIALIYQKNDELQKRLELLEKKIEQENKKNLNSLELAKFYEETEKYEKALAAYQSIYEQKPSENIQTKIKFCRQILLAEEKENSLLQKVEEYLFIGEWSKAVALYKDFLLQYAFLAAQSKSFRTKLEDASASLSLLEKGGSDVFSWLQEKRAAKSLLFLKKQKFCFVQDKLLKTFQTHLSQEMMKIPSGFFWMGGETEEDEYPLHKVHLDTYYIDRFEVTNLLYSYFINNTGYEKPEKWNSSIVPPEEEQFPVEGVSWEDARNYAHWAGKRLPTEAEWEKAARGNDKRIYPWGNDFRSSFCNSLESGIRQKTAVGTFPKGISPYGCADMAGNILEWTEDAYKRYPGGKAPLIEREGYRVARGGSWYYRSEALRCSNRYPLLQSVRLEAVGFRCALSEEEKNTD